jgi:hypothetical protein
MKTDDEKHLNELIDEYKCLVDGPTDDLQRRQLNYETRFCVWPGQSPDLKKHKARAPDCKEPIPWEGATDSRIYLVDQMINEDVDMLCLAYNQATPEAKPVALDDIGKARRTSQFLQWLWSSQLEDIDAEAEILANGMLEDGIAYMNVIWDRRVELIDQEFTLEQIAQAAQAAQFQKAQGNQDPTLDLMLALPQTILDPDRDDDTVELVKALYRQQSERTGDFYETEIPDPATEDVRKGIKELRETGKTTIAIPRLTSNKPCVTALRDRLDVFLPDDTQRLQDARRIYRREFVTAETLDSRALTMGYDQDWVDEIKERAKGMSTSTSYGGVEERSASGLSQSRRTVGDPYIQLDELYEIVHCYERKSNERGVPGIYCTVFSPIVTTMNGTPIYAYSQLLDYDHGQYPFVDFPRERLSRRVTDSRGYGEMGASFQKQLKLEADSRSDLTNISTIPPLMHPAGRPPTRWGPGVKHPYLRPNEFHWADVPTVPSASFQVSQDIRRMADRAFGRPVPDDDPTYARNRRMRMVQRWLECWTKVLSQVFSLCQQFQPESFYFRVTGQRDGEPIQASRDDIQGKFDLSLSYNIAGMEPDMLKQQFELLIQFVQAVDIGGTVDRDELLRLGLEAIHPAFAERLLKNPQGASQAEVDGERATVTGLLNGIDSDVKPGQAHQLRMQTFDQIMQTNPRALQIASENEFVRGLLEKHRKQLQFAVEQKTTNPQAGRIGTLPSQQMGA